MSSVLQAIALVLTALGLGCGLLVLARLGNVRQALAVLLDFLLAAGLIRLSDRPSYQALATAAVVIVIRKIVMIGLRAGPHRTGAEADTTSTRTVRRSRRRAGLPQR
jgi:non-ribosomal peptide synthetase component E (peptide arylation enzyme)